MNHIILLNGKPLTKEDIPKEIYQTINTFYQNGSYKFNANMAVPQIINFFKTGGFSFLKDFMQKPITIDGREYPNYSSLPKEDKVIFHNYVKSLMEEKQSTNTTATNPVQTSAIEQNNESAPIIGKPSQTNNADSFKPPINTSDMKDKLITYLKIGLLILAIYIIITQFLI
ncbi:hypothetical protein GF340_04355 [Candidatus Peregrinibacteria bacterium]|nr:hypothetical protein [Candidatus Peregrinibacteria bacterium]